LLRFSIRNPLEGCDLQSLLWYSHSNQAKSPLHLILESHDNWDVFWSNIHEDHEVHKSTAINVEDLANTNLEVDTQA
jgi:hypothetical protein